MPVKATAMPSSFKADTGSFRKIKLRMAVIIAQAALKETTRETVPSWKPLRREM